MTEVETERPAAPDLWLGRSLWLRRVENAGVASRGAGALARRPGPGLPLMVSLWERSAAALAHLAGDADAGSTSLLWPGPTDDPALAPVVVATKAVAAPGARPAAGGLLPAGTVVQRRAAPTIRPLAVARAAPAPAVPISVEVPRAGSRLSPPAAPARTSDVVTAPNRSQTPAGAGSSRPVARVDFPRMPQISDASAAPRPAPSAVAADPPARNATTSRQTIAATNPPLPAAPRLASPSPPLRGAVATPPSRDAYRPGSAPLQVRARSAAAETATPSKNVRRMALGAPVRGGSAQAPRPEPSPNAQTHDPGASPSRSAAAVGRTPREPIKLGAPEIGRADQVYRLLVDRLARERQRRGA